MDLGTARLGHRGRSEGLLSRVENGLELPSWKVVQLYAVECGGDQAELRRLLNLALLSEKALEAQAAAPAHADGPHISSLPLVVAVALVLRGSDVLLVKRSRPEGELDWQFPSGVVKPVDSSGETAVREVMNETGVTARVIRPLGQRIHPVTNVQCVYFECRYLEGTLMNLDIGENATVSWVAARSVPEYIPARNIFPAILEILRDNSINTKLGGI